MGSGVVLIRAGDMKRDEVLEARVIRPDASVQLSHVPVSEFDVVLYSNFIESLVIIRKRSRNTGLTGNNLNWPHPTTPPLELLPCTLLNFKVSLPCSLHSTLFEHRLPTIILAILATSIISKAHILNLIADFHPHITACWNREELAEQVVDTSGNDEAAEEIQVVNVLGSLGDFLSNSADEPNDID